MVEGGGGHANKRTFRVVGLARDGKYADFDDPPLPYYWTSIFQDYTPGIVITLKGNKSAEDMIPLLRENVPLAAGEVQFTPPSTLARQFSYQFTHLRIASKVLRGVEHWSCSWRTEDPP